MSCSLFITIGAPATGRRTDLLRIAASILFIVTFLSDALDGYIARTRNQITHLGTIIDPLADKALLLSALVLLSRASPNSYQVHLPIWFVWLVISRDCMLVIGAILIHVTMGAVAVKPRIVGKADHLFPDRPHRMDFNQPSREPLSPGCWAPQPF